MVLACGYKDSSNSSVNYRVRLIPLFLENALKKTTEYYLKFLFLFKVQSFRLIMENNFIQRAASASQAVAYTIGSIFKHISDCVQLYFTNGFTNIFVNCLWLVDVTLIFDCNPQIIVQRCQIAAPRWPNDISFFKNRAQNIEFSFGYVARSAVLLKPNVTNILLFKNSFNMA